MNSIHHNKDFPIVFVALFILVSRQPCNGEPEIAKKNHTANFTLTHNTSKNTTWGFLSQNFTNHVIIDSRADWAFNLDCRVNSSRAEVAWYKDGRNLKETNYRFYYHPNLTQMFVLAFKDVEPFERGEYTCEVFDKDKNNISRTFHVEIKGKEEELRFQSVHQKHYNVKAGTSLTLDCHVIGASNLVKYYQWEYRKFGDIFNSSQTFPLKHDEVKIIRLQTDDCSAKYELKDLKTSDSGSYTCIISTQQSFIMREFVVNIDKNNTSNEQNDSTSNGKHLVTIISVSCIAGVLFVMLVLFLLSRWFKSHWWVWRTRQRKRSYHYKSSLSEDPIGVSGRSVFKPLAL